MTGPRENRSRKGPLLVAAVALVVVAAVATARHDETATEVPPEAAGWYGAMSLYRSLAVWAGKRAMSAELHYWKAVG